MPNTAAEKQSPDYTITNNPHALIHCGPIHDDEHDDQRDLTINTSSNCQVIYSKSGNKVEHVQGYEAKTFGHEIDPDQEDAVATATLAKNGDIVLVAEAGSIRMKARNIYMETFDAGKACLVAKDKFVMNGNIQHAGEANMGNPLGKTSIFKSIQAGNWASIINAMVKSCA